MTRHTRWLDGFWLLLALVVAIGVTLASCEDALPPAPQPSGGGGTVSRRPPAPGWGTGESRDTVPMWVSDRHHP